MFIMSLSRHTSEKLRGTSVALTSPLWEKILELKHLILHPTQPSPFTHLSQEDEKQRLQLENQLLENENSHLQKQLDEQQLIASQIELISPYNPEGHASIAVEYKKSIQNILKDVKTRIQAIPARVIFRSFDTWNSFLWINAGEFDNQQFTSPVIANNSPVIFGKAIVGIIDYVGERQSRVRMISDTRLTPSVRALRGAEQDFLIGEQVERLMQQLKHKKNLVLSAEEQTNLIHLLQQLQQNLDPMRKTWYLAKGELSGSMFSSRLGQNVRLKGTGFNYDFSDEEGEARDLHSGKLHHQSHEPGVPILKVNDILVTTGMDGVFPPGFHAAVVTRVGMLKEGDYFYDLEAQPLAGQLEELALVFVLPPIAQDNLKAKSAGM